MLVCVIIPSMIKLLNHFCLFVLTIGVTITELILSELLLYSVIAVVQVTVIVAIVFGAFDVSQQAIVYGLCT